MKINRQAPKGSTIFNLLAPGDVFTYDGELYIKLHYSRGTDVDKDNAFLLKADEDIKPTSLLQSIDIMEAVVKHEVILTVK